MSAQTAVAIGLAFASAVLANLAYAREHDAAVRLPALTLRDPLGSLRLLLEDRAWMVGFAFEAGGFAFYAAALTLGSLALVQAVSAGGIGVLAWASARAAGKPLARRAAAGVGVSFLGLLLLGVSLTRDSAEGSGGRSAAIAVWLAGTVLIAIAVLLLGRRSLLAPAAAYGLAGGLMFSAGDISTKVATGGGVRLLFLVSVVGGYLAGTALLQRGYQTVGGEAVRVAGLATLCANALPIAAGALLLEEPVPGGALGAVRAVAFAAVVFGAFLLSREERPREPAPAPGAAAVG